MVLTIFFIMSMLTEKYYMKNIFYHVYVSVMIALKCGYKRLFILGTQRVQGVFVHKDLGSAITVLSSRICM